jgi:hypothetical protein
MATDFYICGCGPGHETNCQPGNDSNSGTNRSQPWLTYEKARTVFGTMQAGDTINFCRGGVIPIGPFPDSAIASSGTQWVNKNCRDGNRCEIRDYTPAWSSGQNAPKLLAPSNASAFRFENGGNSSEEEGVNIRNLTLQGSGDQWGIMLFNDMDHLLINNLLIENFNIGVQIGGRNAPILDGDGISKDIDLKNSRIINNRGMGFLGNGDDCDIENNVFDNNGFNGHVGAPALDHNFYWSGAARNPDGSDHLTQNSRIVNNILHKAAFVDGQCQGTSLVVHGTQNNLTIEGNTVYEDPGTAGNGCWGISVDGGYATYEEFPGLIIRGNKVYNVGMSGIGCQGCRNSIIENNVVVQENNNGMTAINIPSKPDGNVGPTQNNIVRNNSIFFGR